ncbi:MAG: TlpA disulfide reductase family protein [Gammaproteobacteria bacterium]
MTKTRLGKRLLPLLLILALPAASWAGALRDFDGKVRTLDEYAGKGKWLVVMIWASDCGVCNAEVHNYVDFQTFHGDGDATVIGISMDGMANKRAAEAFIKRHAVNFPNLIGAPQDVAALYTRLTGKPFVGTPSFLLYSPAGQLKAGQAGAVPTDVIEDFIKTHGGAKG